MHQGGEEEQESSINSLPRELMVDILSRVGSNSFTDLVNAKICCKNFQRAAENEGILDGVILQKVSLTNFPVIHQWGRSQKVSDLLNQCLERRNSEALYRQGMVPGQRYYPPVEVVKSCCRQVKKGYSRTNSDGYYLSYIDLDGSENHSAAVEPHLVDQMDTECPVLYQKTCLDSNFKKPVKVTGDVRVIFYEKLIGGRLFYACFNTAFIKISLLQFSVGDLDKVGKRGKSICGPAFCLELLFGPANPDSMFTASSGDGYSSDN